MAFEFTSAEREAFSRIGDTSRAYARMLSEFVFVLHGASVQALPGNQLDRQAWLDRHKHPLLVLDGDNIPGLQWRRLHEDGALASLLQRRDLNSLTAEVHLTTSPATRVEMTFSRIVDYAATTPSRREYMVAALNIMLANNETLDHLIVPPLFIQQLSWAHALWPTLQQNGEQDKNSIVFGPTYDFAPEESVTTWYLDGAGTNTFFYCATGTRVWKLAPPTAHNLHEFDLYRAEHSNHVPVFEKLEEASMTAGNVLIVPSGWVHAVFTGEDAWGFSWSFCTLPTLNHHIRWFQDERNNEGNSSYERFLDICWGIAAFHSKTSIVGSISDTFHDKIAMENDSLTAQEVENLKLLQNFLTPLTRRVPELLQEEIPNPYQVLGALGRTIAGRVKQKRNPAQCPHCQKMMFKRSNLIRHINTIHKDLVDQDLVG